MVEKLLINDTTISHDIEAVREYAVITGPRIPRHFCQSFSAGCTKDRRVEGARILQLTVA
jgi:hypothetical protein